MSPAMTRGQSLLAISAKLAILTILGYHDDTERVLCLNCVSLALIKKVGGVIFISRPTSKRELCKRPAILRRLLSAFHRDLNQSFLAHSSSS
jgi:hypothetical protein